MNFVTRVGNPHAPLVSNSVAKFRKHHFKTHALPCGRAVEYLRKN